MACEACALNIVRDILTHVRAHYVTKNEYKKDAPFEAIQKNVENAYLEKPDPEISGARFIHELVNAINRHCDKCNINECSKNNCEHEFIIKKSILLDNEHNSPICSRCGYEPTGIGE